MIEKPKTQIPEVQYVTFSAISDVLVKIYLKTITILVRDDLTAEFRTIKPES